MKSLLGDELFVDGAIQSLPSDTVRTSPGDFASNHPQDFAAALASNAERTLALLKERQPASDAVFGSCARTNADETCAKNFIERFGAKVARRPLTDDERSFHLETWTIAGKGRSGMEAVLFALLQSPSLAFHIETGAEVEGARTRLTDYEIANRVAYLTTSAPPDAELLAAANAGALQSLGEVKQHAARLLDGQSAAARERMHAFFNYYADLNNVVDADPSVGEAAGITTDALGQELAQEAFDYFETLFWDEGAGYRELMRSTQSFPSTERLRTILSGDAPRLGFLHRPAILTAMGARTSPILRGAHVRVKYLCVDMPPPPNALVDSVLEGLGDIEDQSNRAKTEQLTSSAACSGCHQLINPLGYTFEGFDQLGRARTEEHVNGKTFALDTRVQQPRIDVDDADDFSVADSAELANAIADSVSGPACFVRRAFEFTHARAITDADQCALSEAEAALHSGSMRDAVMALISNDDIFWRAAP